MTPLRRADLTAMLDTARQIGSQRADRFATVTDAVLVRIMGIANPSLCRRIVATPRVARRLDPRLDAAVAAETAAQAAKTEMQVALPDAALPVMEDPPSIAQNVEFPVLSDAISAAITLSASGALISAAELARITSRFGEDAVAFGLNHRRIVPVWMQGIAGEREDVIRQLAATCILAWCEDEPGHHIFALGAAADDPIDIDDEATHSAASALAGAAVAFLNQQRAMTPGEAEQAS